MNFRSLFGTSDLAIDEAQITNLVAGNITDTGLTASQLVSTNASKVLTSVPMGQGQILVGNLGGGFSVTDLTPGTNIQTTAGPGSLTVSVDSNPTFTTVTATNINTTNLTSTNGLISSGLYTVNASMTTAQIQTVISNTAYSVIEFQKGAYSLSTYLNVNRSNIVINGNDSILTLANNTNQPCVFVGDMTTNPPTTVYSNITINNLVLEGNKSNQTQETSITKAWIYNNCCGINLCHYVTLNNCTLNNARSGGLTATYQSKFITVDNCYSEGNYYDGLTAYGSESVRFTNNTCRDNTNGAGISIDVNNLYFVISNNTLNNNNLGIFARQTYDLTCTGNTISANSTHGLFLSGYNQIGDDQGCGRWTISGNSISNNGGSGLFMQSCNDFAVSGNNFYHNLNGVYITTYTMPDSPRGVGSRNNISGNVISGNTNYGFYNSADNSYTNGARDNYLSLNVIKSNTVANISADLTAWTENDDTILNSTALTLHNASGNYCNLTASATGNCALTLPPSNGSANNILKTDGSGLASWTDAPSVTTLTASGITTLGTGTSAINLKYNGVVSTSGAGVVNAGTAQALPVPEGYVAVEINGVSMALPYYTQNFI